MPIVSFLMTVYNCELYVSEALQSVLRQKLPEEFEVIVVDDGSTDDTNKILHSFRDERRHVIETPRRGRSKALNLGIEKAGGEYIAVLDADDVALPNRASIQLHFLRANPEVALVGSRYRTCIDGDGRPVREEIEPSSYEDIVQKLRRHQNCLFHSSVMFSKEKIKQIGGYDEDLPCFIDLDLYVRLAQKYKICNIDDRLSLKRIHKKQFFAGQGGLHFLSESHAAMQVIHERIRGLPNWS